MEIQRVFVKSDGTAVIKCHSCGAVKNVDTKRLPAIKHVLKVQCDCKEVFPVRFEFRMSYRKETNLLGVYQKIINGQGQVQISEKNKANCNIEDISMHGARFKVMGRHFTQEGDEICLGFKLDDGKNNWILKTGIVRTVVEEHIGFEFDEPANEPKALGFYLMP